MVPAESLDELQDHSQRCLRRSMGWCRAIEGLLWFALVGIAIAAAASAVQGFGSEGSEFAKTAFWFLVAGFAQTLILAFAASACSLFMEHKVCANSIERLENSTGR